MTSIKEQVVACVQDLAKQHQRYNELVREKSIRMLMIGVHMDFDVHVYPDCYQIVKDGRAV